MPFRDVPDQEERGILTGALSEYCHENQIESDSFEYDVARQLLVMLYEKGGHRTVGDLKRALIAAIQRQ